MISIQKKDYPSYKSQASKDSIDTSFIRSNNKDHKDTLALNKPVLHKAPTGPCEPPIGHFQVTSLAYKDPNTD